MKLTREKLVEMATIAYDMWADPQHKCPHNGCPYLDSNSVSCVMCHMIEVVLRGCGEAENEWISVDERLPETPDRVLVYLNADSTGRSGFIDTDRILNGRWVLWGSRVDYWMALPQPPKMEGGDNDA